MALERYRQIRDFSQTAEPMGEAPGQPSVQVARSFVIQKHAARRLHWDFRLEMDGVLKSWAVTKEPGLEPGSRRLAVHVEDHPLEYGGFEGIIPKGQYGGGTVMLWDRGRWQPEGDPAEGYAKGKLTFSLSGTRLNGRFTLVRMKAKEGAKDGRDWLLIKGRDPEPVAVPDLGDVSVASGRTMDEIAADPGRVWNSDRGTAPDPSAVTGARPAPLPAKLSPMLATLVTEAPGGDQWLHEIKFDGYRLLARIDGGTCALLTRNGHDWTGKFPTIATACAGLPCRQAWLDGEVVALDAHGVSRFHDLQAALSAGSDAGLIYQVFDLIYLDGYDLAGAALADRKSLLAALIEGRQDSRLRYTDHLTGRGGDFLRQACSFALEGVMSKRSDRPYRPGRGKDWLKAKCTFRQEFVVAGFTRPTGRSSGIGALVLGIHDRDGRLVAVGRVGTGFGEAEAGRIEECLNPLIRPDPVFAPEPGVIWVEPKLVVEVEFAEWTPDGQLRHASYQGLRLDKDPREVQREQGGEGQAEDRLAGFRLTNPDRVVYPEQGLTKRALAEYALEVAPWMLPHIAGRALTLVRCPGGRGEPCFYQRHPPVGMAKAVRRFPDGGEVLMVVDDAPGLIGLVQMGALEIHTWGSTVRDIERPDIAVFDLDPDEGLAWNRVVAGALALRERLGAMGLAAFVKTTGGKGLHVVVPLVPSAQWAAVKAFTKNVAEAIAADEPGRYTANMAKARRTGRIFVDYLRNQRGATFIAPYSMRSRPGAPVAVPVTWEEVQAGIRSDHFTVETLYRRLRALPRDPWDGFFDAARPLPDQES